MSCPTRCKHDACLDAVHGETGGRILIASPEEEHSRMSFWCSGLGLDRLFARRIDARIDGIEDRRPTRIGRHEKSRRPIFAKRWMVWRQTIGPGMGSRIKKNSIMAFPFVIAETRSFRRHLRGAKRRSLFPPRPSPFAACRTYSFAPPRPKVSVSNLEMEAPLPRCPRATPRHTSAGVGIDNRRGGKPCALCGHGPWKAGDVGDRIVVTGDVAPVCQLAVKAKF